MFMLPLPPSVNASLMSSRGRLIKTPVARAWRREACILLKKQMIEKGSKTLRGKLGASYTFHFPDNRYRDQHNYVKQLDDCLKDAGLIEDDHLLFYATLRKVIVKGERKVYFNVWEMEETENDFK